MECLSDYAEYDREVQKPRAIRSAWLVKSITRALRGGAERGATTCGQVLELRPISFLSLLIFIFRSVIVA